MRVAPLFALALWPLSAPAQEVDCTNAVAQSDLNICAQREWQAADKALNTVWPKARAAMTAMDADLPDGLKGGEQALVQAQRAWITFRDAQCKAEGYPMRGGSAEPLLVFGCMTELTRERTQALTRLTEGY